MAKNDSTIIANYSKAFVESYARLDAADEGLIELYKLVEAFQVLGPVGRDLMNDKIPVRMKKGAISKMLKALEVTKAVSNFIELLLENNRLKLLAKITSEIQGNLNKIKGISKINVTLAVELSDKEKKSLSKVILSGIDGLDEKKASLDYGVDPAIIGGAIVQVDSRLLDMSMKTRIRKMRSALLNN